MLKSSMKTATRNFTFGRQPSVSLWPICRHKQLLMPVYMLDEYIALCENAVRLSIATLSLSTPSVFDFLKCSLDGRNWLSTICMNRTGD